MPVAGLRNRWHERQAVAWLTHELARVHRATEKHEKGACITGGWIIEKQDHPTRGALIWSNLYFGPSRRKAMKMRPGRESGNSPFFLHPEIIDEVIKYVNIPKDIADGVRQFAKQEEAEKAKAKQGYKEGREARGQTVKKYRLREARTASSMTAVRLAYCRSRAKEDSIEWRVSARSGRSSLDKADS